MDKKYVIAFDQGTTSTRTIIFDIEGKIVAIAQKELTQHYPQSGWVEHNAEDIFNDQLETFHEVLEETNINPEDIASIEENKTRNETITTELHFELLKQYAWLSSAVIGVITVLVQMGLIQSGKQVYVSLGMLSVSIFFSILAQDFIVNSLLKTYFTT